MTTAPTAVLISAEPNCPTTWFGDAPAATEPAHVSTSLLSTTQKSLEGPIAVGSMGSSKLYVTRKRLVSKSALWRSGASEKPGASAEVPSVSAATVLPNGVSPSASLSANVSAPSFTDATGVSNEEKFAVVGVNPVTRTTVLVPELVTIEHEPDPV